MNSDGIKFQRKLKSGKIQYASLKFTLREGAGYRWVQCLALLDDKGKWMYSGYWKAYTKRRNKTAEKECQKLGWEILNE